MKKTGRAWNGTNWKTFKSFKDACSMLSKKFNNYINNNDIRSAAAIDGEQIRIKTKKDNYSYAHIEIIKGDFSVRKYKY